MKGHFQKGKDMYKYCPSTNVMTRRKPKKFQGKMEKIVLYLSCHKKKDKWALSSNQFQNLEIDT